MAHEGYHEPEEKLTAHTKDLHRAIISLQEELEAVDWYQQRIDASEDEELKAVLAHNRDEEKEHASMVLEWIRRRDPAFDAHLRKFLFTTAPLGKDIEDGAPEAKAAPSTGSLTVASMRTPQRP